MKEYIIFNYFGTFIVATKGTASDVYVAAAECRDVHAARKVRDALQEQERE